MRYAPTEEESLELLESHLIAKFVPEEQKGQTFTLGSFIAGGFLETAEITVADDLYILDSTATTGKASAFVEAYFTVGPYELYLDVDLNSGLGLYEGDNLTPAEYRAAVEVVAENVRDQIEAQAG